MISLYLAVGLPPGATRCAGAPLTQSEPPRTEPGQRRLVVPVLRRCLRVRTRPHSGGCAAPGCAANRAAKKTRTSSTIDTSGAGHRPGRAGVCRGFAGIAIRAPIPLGSIADIDFVIGPSATVDGVNDVFRQEAQTLRHQGILGVSEEPLMAAEIAGKPRAGVVDLDLTRVVDNDALVKVMALYDNEWGLTHQISARPGPRWACYPLLTLRTSWHERPHREKARNGDAAAHAASKGHPRRQAWRAGWRGGSSDEPTPPDIVDVWGIGFFPASDQPSNW